VTSDPVEPAPTRLFSRRLALLMDDLVRIPGTQRGVGLDAVIGLVPGVGDLLGSGISTAIMVDAVRARVPVHVLAVMAWNLVLDALLGLIPFAGDLVDVAHRANRRNYLLLEAAVAKNPHPGPPTIGYLAAALVLTVLPLVLSLGLAVLAVVLLVRWLAG
jgi:hypothetical protein